MVDLDSDLAGGGATWKHRPRLGQASLFTTLDAEKMRGDSGRLFSARILLEDIVAQLKDKWLPPVSWVMRERLVSMTVDVIRYEQIDEAALFWTVSDIEVWARQYIDDGMNYFPDGAQVTFGLGGIGSDGVSANALAATAGVLIEEGLGEVAVADLCLPGPSGSPPEDRSYRYDELYAESEITDRLIAFFDACLITYQEVYNHFFPGLRGASFLAQCPVRPHVYWNRIQRRYGQIITGRVWHEPVENWGESAIVKQESFDLRGMQAVFDTILSQCHSLGRPAHVVQLSGLNIEWDPYRPAVTRFVAKMIQTDFERLLKSLERGR